MTFFLSYIRSKTLNFNCFKALFLLTAIGCMYYVFAFILGFIFLDHQTALSLMHINKVTPISSFR